VTVGLARVDYAGLDEAGLCALASRGDGGAFGVIIQRCNERLFRIARSVLSDDCEAEDVLQETYLRAFAALRDFRGEASLATWLSAITLNVARARLRRQLRRPDNAPLDDGHLHVVRATPELDPEAEAALNESRRLIERAVDDLPTEFRLVFILRDIQGCSVAETSASLGVKSATVRSRLFRARIMLRQSLDRTLGEALKGAFPFKGARCARIASAVLERLSLDSPIAG
jgi:RNA polymerase sigma-70 factor (ECF subfamily)